MNLLNLFRQPAPIGLSPTPVAPKPALRSLTIQSASFSALLGLWLAISPSVGGLLQSNAKTEKAKANIGYVMEIINQVAGFLVVGSGATAIAGRLRVGDLYTPKGLPGANLDDFVKPPEEP